MDKSVNILFSVLALLFIVSISLFVLNYNNSYNNDIDNHHEILKFKPNSYSVKKDSIKMKVTNSQKFKNNNIDKKYIINNVNKNNTINKSASAYLINIKTNNVIKTKKGTIITIPKNAFRYKDSKKLVNDSIISFIVDEYLDLNEMLLGNLSTQCGKSLLTTGGMIYLNAEVGGRLCELAPNKLISVKLPSRENDNNMNLFFANNLNNMDWQFTTNAPLLYSSKEINIKKPEPIIGNYAFYEQLMSLIGRYSDHAKHINKEGKVVIGFMVDIDSTIGNIQVVHSLNPYIDSIVLSAFLKMDNKWLPAQINNKSCKYSNVVGIGFFEEDNDKISNEQLAKDFLRINYNYLDSIKYTNGLYSATYYFETALLGWLNIDKIYNNNKDVQDIFVDNYSENDNISLVFNDIRAILRPAKQGDKLVFKNVPNDLKATVIAFNEKATNPYFDLIPIDTKEKINTVKLSYEPMSFNLINEKLYKLNPKFKNNFNKNIGLFN